MENCVYKKKIYPIALKFDLDGENSQVIDEQTEGTLQPISFSELVIQDMTGTSHHTKSCNSKKQLKTSEKISGGIPAISAVVSVDIGVSRQTGKEAEKSFYSFTLSKNIKKISIPENKVKTTETFNDKIRNALKLGNKEAVFKELTNIFKDYGSVVPRTLILGGKLSVEVESSRELSQEQVEVNIAAKCKYAGLGINTNSSSSSFFKENSVSTTTIGGESSTNDLDKTEQWFKSICEQNIDIIEYKDLRPIYEFLPNDLRSEVEKYKDYIPENKREHYNIYSNPDSHIQSKSNKTKFDPGKSEYSDGYVDDRNEYLRKKKFLAEKKAASGFSFKETDKVSGQLPPNTRIVGWKCVSRKRVHDYNAYITIRKDPLSGDHRSYDFFFESCVKRDIGYDVYLYYFEYPK